MSFFAFLTLVFGSVALVLALGLLLGEKRLRGPNLIQLGVVTVSAATAYKLLAFFGILVVPGATLVAAHSEMIEGAMTVESCAKCHVMQPMVTDMVDPKSDSLAARHFKNGYIAEDQCYHCHSGYGFNGAFSAKLEGYRHLVRYTTKTYEEPIKMRGHFDVESCFECHLGTAPFEAINSHHVALARLSTGQMSCLNCHGPAHPTRSERTPGSADYERLMTPVEIPGGPHRVKSVGVRSPPELRLNGPLPPRRDIPHGPTEGSDEQGAPEPLPGGVAPPDDVSSKKPRDTGPGDTAPRDTAPRDTAPRDTAPRDTAPGDEKQPRTSPPANPSRPQAPQGSTP